MLRTLSTVSFKFVLQSILRNAFSIINKSVEPATSSYFKFGDFPN